MFFCKNKVLIIIFISMIIFPLLSSAAPTEGGNSGMGMGIPFGGVNEDAYMDVCPQGARVVFTFLEAWSNKDYKTMYYLIDDEAKHDYTFEDAKFDLQFMDYKEYKISSARKQGNNFQFILSHGEWKYGDKDIKKILVNGRTFKIMMPSRGVLFKKSADSYF